MVRRDRLIREREHDVYRTRKKLPEHTVCSDCGALYRRGRWQWGEAPAEPHAVVCPACQRVRDDCPAGVLTLVGDFNLKHREEVIGLLRNVEIREARQHSQKRIMSVVEGEGEVTITTTDSSLARSLGTALHHAYAGELDYRYGDGNDVLRVRWER
jgi:NMD protein affecting ribosome stability and mRNA decay